jgi:hypothetical protein
VEIQNSANHTTENHKAIHTLFQGVLEAITQVLLQQFVEADGQRRVPARLHQYTEANLRIEHAIETHCTHKQTETRERE